MDWLTFIASLVGAVAAIASAVAAVIVLRRQAAAERPFVIVDQLVPFTEGEPGFRIGFRITNPSTTEWRVESAKICKPRGATIMDSSSISRDGDPWNPDPKVRYDLIEYESLTDVTRLNGYIHASGSRLGGGAVGPADISWQSLLIFVAPPKRATKLSIRLALVSPEANQRKMSIAIRRTLPAGTAEAKA